MKLNDSTSAAADLDGDIASNVGEVKPAKEWVAYLTRHLNVPLPVSTSQKAQQLDLAYQEYVALCAAGEMRDADSFCARFPSIQHSLGELILAHHFGNENPELVAAPSKTAWPQPGETFLGFNLLRELGHGGFARVFLATEPALGNRKVAVKVSSGSSAEAHTQGRICHPNIVPVYSVDRDEERGLTAVCMPYLGSATLADLLDFVKAVMPKSSAAILESVRGQEQPDLPEGQDQPWSLLRASSYVDGVCMIAAYLADALQFIHSSNIYHRDLKPANVLMTPDGRPMLLDFNLSTDMTTGGTGLGGTLPYMPPEQLKAAAPAAQDDCVTSSADPLMVNAQSELYSFGVMLFELLTGQHPFGPLSLKQPKEETRKLLLTRQKRGSVSLRQLNPEVSPALAKLVEQCLAYNPKDRPRHASELAVALRRGLSPLRRVQRLMVRHSWLTAAVACGVMAVAGLGATWSSQQETEVAGHWRLGKQAAKEQDYKAAIEHFDALLKANPGRADVLLSRAHAFMKWGESDHHHYNNALADLRQADRLQGSGAISSAAGYCMIRLGMSNEESKAEFQCAINQGFAGAVTYNNLAYCCMRMARFGEAEQHLDQALKLDANLRAALHNRGRLRLHQVYAANGFDPPTRQAKMPADAVAKENLCIQWLQQGKADFRKAMACPGAIPRDLYYDAALLWGICAGYFPNDIGDTLDFLDAAVKLGTDQAMVASEPAFEKLRDNQHFRDICDRNVVKVFVPATSRLADPLAE